MADVKKTVEIALNIIGADTKTLKTVVTSFEAIQKAVDSATISINKFQKALDSIKIPGSFSQIVDSLKQLSGIKVPNLTNIATGFDKLGKLKAPPDLSKFVTELEKFAGIKLPGVSTLVAGFEKLTKLDVDGVVNKIRQLNTALAELDKKGGISAFKNFSRDVATMKTSFGSAEQSTKQMSNALKEVGATATSTGLRLGSFAEKVKTVLQFRLISEAILNLKSAINSGVTSIVEYDQALKDLQAITGATSLEVAQMGMKILEVASTTKFSASEVASGMRTIGQAGFSASEAVETMQAVSDLATGTLSDMGTTVDLVTTAMRVYRIDASESAMVSDVFANAVNRSKLTVDKLRTAMNYVGPIARDSGVSFKELAASMGTLANSGLRASTIGTGLRRVFAELIDPSKKLTEASREAGVALSELDPRTSSLSDVMRNLSLVVDDAQVAFDVFGKRGASAVLALSSAESNFDSMLQTISAQGTAAQQAAIQMEGLGVSFKNLQDKIGLLAIALGDAGIADAMRILIDLARDLVDVFTNIINNSFVQFVIKASLVAGSVYGIAQALIALGKVKAIGSMVLGFELLTTNVALAKAGIGSLVSSFGGLALTIGLVVGAIALMYNAFDKSGKASDEAAKLADEYGSLAKSFQDYEVRIVSLEKSSKAFADENTNLRTILLETASGFSEISTEALAAANSIDPFTGEIEKGSTALQEYNDALDKIQLSKLVEAGNKANEAMVERSDFISRYINKVTADFKTQTGNLLAGEGSKFLVFGKAAADAEYFAKEIAEGTVSLKQMSEYIQGLDHTNLTSQQKDIIEGYQQANEQSDKFVKFLIDTNRIGLDDTVENIQKLAEDSGLTGVALGGVIEKLKDLKTASSGSFDNIIEKWGTDGTTAITDFVDEYRSLGGVFAEGEEAQIQENAARKQGLVEQLADLKTRREAEEAAGVSIEQSWKNYYANERVLLKEASVLKKEISQNNSAQNILVLQSEREALEKSLAEIAVQYKNNASLRVKYQEVATREYIVKEKKLLEGISIDYSKQEDDYKNYLIVRKNLAAQSVASVAEEEAKGLISAEGASAERLLIHTQMYQDMLEEAIRFQNMVSAEENIAEYESRHQAVLKAEESFYKARAKYINTYNKEITDSNKKIIEAYDDIADETEKNSDEITEITAKRNSDLKKLATDYKDKRVSIEEALQDKLKDINQAIQDNRATTSSDILTLETTTEEKIRNVRKQSLGDSQKNASDQRAAFKYLAEGRVLLAEAEAQKDKEKLNRGTELVKMSESLATGLDDETTSVKLLQSALASLTDARNIKGELKELDLLKKKNEEISDAAEKQAKEKVMYDSKVQAAIKAIDKIAIAEAKRHKDEMANLDAEIAKYEEKIKVATGRLDSAPMIDTSTEDIKALVAEDKRHAEEMQNIQNETNALQEKYSVAKNGIDKYALSQKELDMGFDEFLKTLPELSRLMGDSLEDITSTSVEIPVDDTELVETKSLMESMTDTVLDIFAKVLGKDDVDDLQKSIDKLRDKTVTITTKYVTQGQSAAKGYTGGGRLPGFGGGDRRNILAEDGEWIINKYAVRKFGDNFMEGINNMTLPKFATGGRVSVPTGSPSTNSGSIMNSLANFGTVNLDTGNVSIPAIVRQDVVGELTSHLNNLKRFQT